METLLILLFCLAVGYVCVWVLVNEQRGNVNGEWGIIAMRVPEKQESEGPTRPIEPPSEHRGWKP